MTNIPAKLERMAVEAAEKVRRIVNKQFDHKELVKRVHHWRGLSPKEQNRLNREQLDRFCVRWENVVRRPVPQGRAAKYDLVFMHIPKAGGSTLDNIIPKNYDINGVVHINQPLLYRNPSALFKEGAFPRAVLGHYKFTSFVYQCVQDPIVHITMLREPVDRIISYYNFLLAAPGHGRHKQAVKNSIDKFVEALANHECHNGQALRIAGYLSRKFIRRPTPPDDALELARENLERRFTLFGLVERYGEFLLTCRKLLGWRDLYYSKKKVTRDTANRVRREELSDAVITKIQELNAIDMAFYDWAARLMEQRCQEIGITDQHVNQFRERNKIYHDLLTEPYWDDGRA